MKKVSFVCLVVLLASIAFAQSAVQKPESANTKPATNLYFVFLNRPSNAPTYSKEKSEEIQAGHMANIKRLHGEGKLVMAGPFMDDTTLRGIFVFKAKSIDEVKGWIATDPAIIAGRLAGDVHPWEPAKGEIHVPAKDAPMENFVMLIYRWTTDAKSKSKEAMGAAFQGHKKYQLELFESGKTEIGGPFSDAMTSEFIGVIIGHGNRQEGEKLAAGDPLVEAGVARAEVHEWITARGVLQR
jgi:uncharacterized protein YciI